MTIMAKNAPAYGLDHLTPDPAVEYDTILTSSPTNLALIGDLSDIPVSQLVQLNPALLRSIAPGNFEIRVPKGMGTQVRAGLDLVPTEQRVSSRMHRVEPGENLASIARLYNASATQIAVTNNLRESQPAEGDRLVVPAAYHEVVPSVRSAMAAGYKASGRTAHSPARSLTASRKAPVKGRTTTTASAKKPLHPATGTLAQLSHNRALNR
jgi:hypothetical protein